MVRFNMKRFMNTRIDLEQKLFNYVLISILLFFLVSVNINIEFLTQMIASIIGFPNVYAEAVLQKKNLITFKVKRCFANN